MTRTEARPQRLGEPPEPGGVAGDILLLDEPYKGLSYYAEHDAPFFFGRERTTQIVTANLIASRLTLLYGESGVGKSSLLRAGVARHLHELALESIERGRTPKAVVAVFPVHDEREGDVSWRGDPLHGIALAIERAVAALGLGVEPPPGDLPFGELLAAWTGLLGCDLLIVLDQFEEYLLYHPGEDGDGTLATELPRVLAQPNLRASFLISIREDALAKLDRFKGRIPGLFDNYLRVRHLDRESAREAIVKPVDKYNELTRADPPITIEDDLVEALLDELEAGRVVVGVRGVGSSGPRPDDADDERRVETPYLQLVMTRLWKEERPGSSVLRWSTLDRLGHSEQIVRTHLDGALGELPPRDREVAARIFRYLVTPSGSKIAHAVPDLAAYADVPEVDVARVVERLTSGETRILRPVGERTVEIYHDVLAAAVLDWCTRYVQSARERRRRRMRIAVGAVVLTLGGGALAAALVAWQRQAAKATDATHLAAQRAQALQLPYARQVFLGNASAVTGAAFSSDGKQVLTAGGDGTLRLWSVRTGAQLDESTAVGPLAAASFGPGGSLVAAGGEDGAYVWSTTTNRIVPLGVQGPVTAAAFRPGGRSLIVARASGAIDFVAWPQDRRLAHFVVEGGRLRAAALDARGTHLVTASEDGLVREFALGTPTRLVRTLRVSKLGPATAAAISARAGVIASGGADGRAGAWPPRSIGRAATMRGSSAVTAVAVSRSGDLVAVGRSNGTVQIWGWKAKTVFAVVSGHTGPVLSLAFSPNGQSLVTAGADRTARVWSVPRPNLTVEIERVSTPAPNRVSAVVTVANVGDVSSPPTVLQLTSPGGGKAEARIPSLTSPSAVRFTRTLAIPPTSGSVTVLASVNAGRQIPEASYADDSATASTGQRPDLAVQTLGIDQLGDSLVITVGVSNLGTADSLPTALTTSVPAIGARGALPIAPVQPGGTLRLEVRVHIPASAAGKRVVGYVTLPAVPGENAANNKDQTAPFTLAAPTSTPTVPIVVG